MKVYKCKFNNAYGLCVGLMVVAANSEEEACQAAMNCGQGWLYYYESEVGCLHKKIWLLPNVTADVDKPQILYEECLEE